MQFIRILPTGSWIWCHIQRMTAKPWQTSKPVQPPGVSSVLFPPRNLGFLTKNRHNFPKATIIQPLSSPKGAPPPYKKMHLLGHLFMFPRKPVFKTSRFHISPPFSIFSFFVLFCLSYGKNAVINDQVVFVCTVLGFHVPSSVLWPCQDMFNCMLYLNSFFFHAQFKAVPKKAKKKEK